MAKQVSVRKMQDSVAPDWQDTLGKASGRA
jgi:hypothetical protein